MGDAIKKRADNTACMDNHNVWTLLQFHATRKRVGKTLNSIVQVNSVVDTSTGHLRRELSLLYMPCTQMRSTTRKF